MYFERFIVIPHVFNKIAMKVFQMDKARTSSAIDFGMA